MSSDAATGDKEIEMKKKLSILVMIALVVLLSGCDRVDPPVITPEDPVTTEGKEESTEAPTETETEPETEKETEPAGSSMKTFGFDGKKTAKTLESYARAVFESTFANMDEVKGFSYLYVGDGVEIYRDNIFCGWFASWDFSDMGEMKETKTVRHDDLGLYLQHQFGSDQEPAQKNRETSSDSVIRYEYEMKKSVGANYEQWLVEKRFAASESEAKNRCTYPVSIYVYLTERTYCGYMLYLDRTTVSAKEAESLAKAVTFTDSSFDYDRRVPVMEAGIQENCTRVENALVPVMELQEIVEWFGDYNGEVVQRIAGTKDDNYSPAKCPDIVFYRAEAGEKVNEVLSLMFKEMMEPLKAPSDVRKFTVTGYFLDTQKLEPYEDRDNMWILPYLNGYYSYTGVDTVSMDIAMNDAKDSMKNGMVPFIRQGGNGEFQFILIKEGNVYRLQRAVDMGLVQDPSGWK